MNVRNQDTVATQMEAIFASAPKATPEKAKNLMAVSNLIQKLGSYQLSLLQVLSAIHRLYALTLMTFAHGIGAVIITLLIIGFIMYRRRGERELKQLRKSYFRQNGGLILHQKISGIDVLKIFTAQELENATDKYDEANIIGRGGFGVVYKGIILDDKQVAIKRSLKVDPNQVEQFINEVLILSQINNRNVVKLLGCCLETEVPLLVYEFINNGTLYAHLHDEEKVSHLTWNLRLRIASEIADVLSYLHTTISTPIIHRDMKSMNVLLDESYTAKVADFGASKLVPLDQDQLATMVVGTRGYLDPEYMRSFELTEKSDVYSFGVVLVELLTKKKALSNQESEIERCLALHFLSKMKEDRLFDIVDKNISNGPKEIEQIKKVASLAKLCLRLKREKRPTMKEVAMELEGIKRMSSNVEHGVGGSFDELESFGGHLVQFPTVDDGNNGGEEASSSLVIAPHCTSKCGNVTIPYPFGIEEGCYYVDRDNPNDYPMMQLKCDHSTNPHNLILGENIQVSSINLTEGEIRINLNMSFRCYSQGELIGNHSTRANLVTFTISSTKNKLVATGCDTYAWFTGVRHGEKYYTGCMTQCDSLNGTVDNQCNGVGCCEASIPDGVTNITTRASSFDNHTTVPFNPCSVAFPVATDAFTFLRENLTQTLGFYSDYHLSPVVFNWGIGKQGCLNAQQKGTCLCKNNTICIGIEPDQDGYRCECKDGFAGNPYLPQGCQDIDECEGANNKCQEKEYCHNIEGSYICVCPKGYHGNGTETDHCISSSKAWLTPVIITAGIGGSIITLLVIGFLLYWRIGERRIKKLRESFFRQNGGLILHQKLSRMDALKIFTAQDLEIATDKYNAMNIIGRGGYGIVYKGVIANNQQVAIKRSLKVDPGQVEQFINEILVLSQINNRNVVKLLGCCLETEVPLLVYEFISNGTLYDHLNDEAKARRFTLNIRLRIASEVAEVLAYLHTTISTPIIHRDMKSMNILLDECLTAK
ncbi:hypothetical protein KSS87_019735, partial [Heliosperma pusillum]